MVVEAVLEVAAVCVLVQVGQLAGLDPAPFEAGLKVLPSNPDPATAEREAVRHGPSGRPCWVQVKPESTDWLWSADEKA